MTVEGDGFRMPLRLQGDDHWTVSYRNTARPSTIFKHRARSANDAVVVTEPGTWEIVAVEDDMCPGVVDAKAATFDTAWIPKPAVSVVEAGGLSGSNGVFDKTDICEGDADAFELSLSGEFLLSSFFFPTFSLPQIH